MWVPTQACAAQQLQSLHIAQAFGKGSSLPALLEATLELITPQDTRRTLHRIMSILKYQNLASRDWEGSVV